VLEVVQQKQCQTTWRDLLCHLKDMWVISVMDSSLVVHLDPVSCNKTAIV
jgi:hypothetical protein